MIPEKDTVASHLEAMLARLDPADRDRFFSVRDEIIQWMEQQQPEQAVPVRDWVAALTRRIDRGEARWEQLEPFVYGLLGRHEATSAALLGDIMARTNLGLTEELAEALGELGSRAVDAVPALTTVVTGHAEEWPRAKAAFSLGQIGDHRAVPALMAALHDPASSVRRSAIEALHQLGSRTATSEVLRLLEHDPDYVVRSVAASTLGDWKVREARPLLERMLAAESNPTLLKATREALAALS